MKNYGLIGKDLSHSFSKDFFEKKFLKENIQDASYQLFQIDSLQHLKPLIRDKELSGFNVTIPYKEDILPYLDEIRGIAREIGAVNTVHIRDGRSIGYNTDAVGFQKSIKPFLASQHDRALILGTGGASKAVEYVLNQLGLDVFFVTRKPSGLQSMPYSALNEVVLSTFKLIVNTTPVGTHPAVNQCPDIPFQFIGQEHLVIDLIYNPSETLFLKNAKAQGATTLNGWDMLVAQAEASWDIWQENNCQAQTISH